MGNDDDTHTLSDDDAWIGIGVAAMRIVERLKQAPEGAAERGKRPAEVSGGNDPGEGLFARNVGCTRSSVALASEMVGRASEPLKASPRPILPGAEAAARRGTGAECEFSCAVSRADGVAQEGACVKGDAIIGSGRDLLDGLAGAGRSLRGLARLGVDLQQRGGQHAELRSDFADGLHAKRGDDFGRVIFAGMAASRRRSSADLAGERHGTLDIGLQNAMLFRSRHNADSNSVFENRAQLFQIDCHLFYLQFCGALGRETICGGQHAKPGVSHSASSFAKHTPRFFVAIDEFQPQIADALFRHMSEHPNRANDALFLFVLRHDTRSKRPETRTSATTAAIENAADMRMRNCVIAV